jgi:hypothetical protein
MIRSIAFVFTTLSPHIPEEIVDEIVLRSQIGSSYKISTAPNILFNVHMSKA